MLGSRRPFADPCDVLANLGGQIIDMLGIPRIVLVNAAPLGKSRVDTTKAAEIDAR
jgi:hypothetical protein